MADVFVSYAHEDRKTAARIAELLQNHGYLVWWDQRIPLGNRFDKEIELQLKGASAVVVLWSRCSVESSWVREEAAVAAEKKTLIPVRINDADLPPPHRLVKTLDLTRWDHSFDATEILDLLSAVEGKRNSSLMMFMAAVTDRERGRARVASTLMKIAEARGAYSDLARIELAYHEYARLGDAKAFRKIHQIAEPAADPFVVRALSLLKTICYLAAGEYVEAAQLLEKAPPRTMLSEEQIAFIALHEILAYGALDDSAQLREPWELLSETRQPERSTGYPSRDVARKFDRALISVIYGKEPVENLLSGLPIRDYRGLAHLAASNSRAIRKSPFILRAIEIRGQREGWKQPNDIITMRRRCRTFERSVLPVAGTLFGPGA